VFIDYNRNTGGSAGKKVRFLGDPIPMIVDNNLASLWVIPKNNGDIKLDQGGTQKLLLWSSLTTSILGQVAGSNPAAPATYPYHCSLSILKQE